jgi:hypothetical protein
MFNSQPALENKKPAINHRIKLHTAMTDTGYQTLLKKQEEEDDVAFNRYPECIDNEGWDTFLVNPFDLDILRTFTRTNLQSQHKDDEIESMTPPYRISFKSITLDFLPVKDGEQQIEVCHMNAYQIIPGIMYTLLARLKGVLRKSILNQPDVKCAINYVSRYCYATRSSPLSTMHLACTEYNIKYRTYLNQYKGDDEAIPVSVMLASMYNACNTSKQITKRIYLYIGSSRTRTQSRSNLRQSICLHV